MCVTQQSCFGTACLTLVIWQQTTSTTHLCCCWSDLLPSATICYCYCYFLPTSDHILPFQCCCNMVVMKHSRTLLSSLCNPCSHFMQVGSYHRCTYGHTHSCCPVQHEAGHVQVNEYDCLLLEFVFGNRPDDAQKVRAHILEIIASDPGLQQTELVFLGLFGRSCRVLESQDQQVSFFLPVILLC